MRIKGKIIHAPTMQLKVGKYTYEEFYDSFYLETLDEKNRVLYTALNESFSLLLPYYLISYLI